MTTKKELTITINGRRLDQVHVPMLPKFGSTGLSSMGYPASMHRCTLKYDGLEIRTQVLTVAQLFFEGVITSDRQRRLRIKIGATKEVYYTVDAFIIDDDHYQRSPAILRFKSKPIVEVPGRKRLGASDSAPDGDAIGES